MAYQLDVKKLFNELRGPKGVAALTEELVKVSDEVEILRVNIQPQAEAKLKLARKNVDEIQKLLKKAQAELDSELKKTISIVKKYGEQAERRLANIKASVTKKKAVPRKATKKTASKKKTTKKKA
jgi:hypothetical protein